MKAIGAHREWMIRVFAIALGVATIRAVAGIGQAVTGGTLEDVFALSFWLGARPGPLDPATGPPATGSISAVSDAG